MSVNRGRFVGVRLTNEETRKVLLLSLNTNVPGSLSEGLRWAIDNAKVSATSAKSEGASHQPAESEVQHA